MLFENWILIGTFHDLVLVRRRDDHFRLRVENDATALTLVLSGLGLLHERVHLDILADGAARRAITLVRRRYRHDDAARRRVLVRVRVYRLAGRLHVLVPRTLRPVPHAREVTRYRRPRVAVSRRRRDCEHFAISERQRRRYRTVRDAVLRLRELAHHRRRRLRDLPLLEQPPLSLR